jgi:hypothetical protein
MIKPTELDEDVTKREYLNDEVYTTRNELEDDSKLKHLRPEYNTRSRMRAATSPLNVRKRTTKWGTRKIDCWACSTPTQRIAPNCQCCGVQL